MLGLNSTDVTYATAVTSMIFINKKKTYKKSHERKKKKEFYIKAKRPCQNMFFTPYKNETNEWAGEVCSK